MAPLKKPLVQPAARCFLRRRPFKPELDDSLFHNTDELFIWLFISALSLTLREADDGKRVGSVTEADNFSASEAARKRLSSNSLSLTLTGIMSLAAAEGH